ncbi:hypothetical protein K488DRAFT_76341 [Vararia minispora EC-137]|uniref:Uncharacterized protein n=1 Tax=Vararia minispora EC-137 TaxID=1314806 RepID=A0ACB8QVI8_9AGAM|nr:hypothetical protein K488DRAFT_76341 [Vararia minispora EC-137]
MIPTLFLLALAPLSTLAYRPLPDGIILAPRATTYTCNPARNGLATGTLQYVSDCNATTFCQADGTCAAKGCRRDEFPLGYPQGGFKADGVPLPTPPKCDNGQFCPDEGSSCQSLIAVGGQCQLDRDDSCQPPSNFKDLRDTSGFGLNVNGSVCLNFVCMWANVTVGQQCVVENVGYITYGANSTEFVDIVSRDNCMIGNYCDATQSPHVCVARKALAASCSADKECQSYNCNNGACGLRVDTPRRFGTWVYVVIAVCIFGGIIGTLVALFFIHARQRDAEREKRLQYWREQNAYRQNIVQMQESARMSIFSANSRRSTMFGTQTEDSQAPMLQHGAKAGSGLRYYVSEDGASYREGSIDESEGLVMRQHQGGNEVKPAF